MVKKNLVKKPKPKNEDVNQIAFRVVKESTSEDNRNKSPKKLKY
jgi:hypothetical protein